MRGAPGRRAIAMNEKKANEPRLLVLIRGEPALRLNPAGGRYAGPDAAEWLIAGDRMSSGWNPPIDMFRLSNWLEHALPENGLLGEARGRAADELMRQGVRRDPSGPADILWGNPGLDCPGAVRFVSEFADGRTLRPPEDALEPLDDAAIGQMIQWAAYLCRGRGPPPRQPDAESRSSLTGFRPKIGLHRDPATGSWLTASATRLGTHIVKMEDHAGLPGEAMAESVSLRALSLAGVPVADTATRVFGDVQCIVSERTDRTVLDGTVLATHQEEWGQAACLSTREKFAHQSAEPGWPHLRDLLSSGTHGGNETDAAFIKALVGCALMGHTDLHRQNIGIAGDEDGHPLGLAPLYDVSCLDGRPRAFTRRFAIPIGGADTTDQFDAKALFRLADDCGIDRGLAADAARDIAASLPASVREAKRESADRNEARTPSEVRPRLEAIASRVESRCLKMHSALGLSRRRPTVPPAVPSSAKFLALQQSGRM